jgi:hypothetical protein
MQDFVIAKFGLPHPNPPLGKGRELEIEFPPFPRGD